MLKLMGKKIFRILRVKKFVLVKTYECYTNTLLLSIAVILNQQEILLKALMQVVNGKIHKNLLYAKISAGSNKTPNKLFLWTCPLLMVTHKWLNIDYQDENPHN